MPLLAIRQAIVIQRIGKRPHSDSFQSSLTHRFLRRETIPKMRSGGNKALGMAQNQLTSVFGGLSVLLLFWYKSHADQFRKRKEYQSIV